MAVKEFATYREAREYANSLNAEKPFSATVQPCAGSKGPNSPHQVTFDENFIQKVVKDRTRSNEECLTPNDRVCNDCGSVIPEERVALNPSVNRCVACQKIIESKFPHAYVRRVDEGIAGTREDNKRMRAKDWGDMMSRS